MSTRRSFFKYIGLGAGVAAGGAAAAVSMLPDSEKEKTIKDIESAPYNNKLTIGATYGERAQKFTNSNYIITSLTPQFVPGTRKDVQVSMTVGPDGEMYLMTNGKWRRIVTE